MNDYLVTLHNTQKHHKTLTVRCCVSPQAAVRVADYLEKINGYSRATYQATMARQIN